MKPYSALGKSNREGISLIDFFNMFPEDKTARLWFEEQIWPDGAQCPHCKSNNFQSNIKHDSTTNRCRDCSNRPMFSVKKGTVMEGSKIIYQKCSIANYLITTNLKGVSSMKLHRKQLGTWFTG